MPEQALRISVSKPRGRPAAMLCDMGVEVIAIEADEGNVDRYVISRRVGVERRTGSSFLRGILDKTLFTSAIYLREHFRIPILIVEGQVNYEYSAFDPRAVTGALTAMMLQYGLNVLSTGGLEETVRLIAMLARQEQVGIPEISLIPKRKATSLPDLQRRVIEMLPGCGMTVARDLLQHLGSVRRIANAAEPELRDVRGIGVRKAHQIRRVLNDQYEAVDTERNLEDALERDPGILFREPVVLLARQHHIYTEQKERHVVDMVFLDSGRDEVVLVELKRGAATPDACAQLRRYVDNAGKSKLIRSFLDRGARVRGILATLEEGGRTPDDPHLELKVLNRRKVIDVLLEMRKERLAALESAPPDG